ncbi:MAG: glycosyltransferase family 2 protein, partial [Longimicrobiales bacterium]
DYRELGKAQRQFIRYLDQHPRLRAVKSEDPQGWQRTSGQIVEMAWRTYRHRWKNMYRARLSRGEWAKAAFQMPFIPAYYKEVLPYLLKSLVRGR